MATSSNMRIRCEAPVRDAHQTVLVGNKLYLWGGKVDNLPEIHDCLEKRKLLANVDVFHSDIGDWIRYPTSGDSPLGVNGYSCTAVGDAIHFFGGWCGHDNCFYNSLHTLSTSSMQWVPLLPKSGTPPMRKNQCGMVAFKDGMEHILYVLGGIGPNPSDRLPEARYRLSYKSKLIVCNEQHMFSLYTREWSSPDIIGQPPSPCSHFSLTSFGERRAALFGGMSGSIGINDLMIVDLGKHAVRWTTINKPINHSIAWPIGRAYHAATCVSAGSLLIVLGGLDGYLNKRTICELWINDLNAMLWQRLEFPDFVDVTERMGHSLSAIQLNPHRVLLVMFGGRRSHNSARLSDTVLIELIQRNSRQWEVGRVVRRKSFENMAEEMIRQLVEEKRQIQHHLHVTLKQQQSRQSREKIAAESLTIEQPHWVVRREEVKLTDEVLGKGSWGEVKVAIFCGIKVAAKFLHDTIISDHNRQLFIREMIIAANIRHPNLLLFIGATLEEEAIILTEHMPTSLVSELYKRVMPPVQIVSIAKYVARALRYLHQWKPSPIIHRDVSCDNVLLEPLPNNGWRAKVSDYGSANFMNVTATVAPGNPAYAAPEACYPDQHSPKMDTFSFGVLLIEMCLQQGSQIKREGGPSSSNPVGSYGVPCEMVYK